MTEIHKLGLAAGDKFKLIEDCALYNQLGLGKHMDSELYPAVRPSGYGHQRRQCYAG